MIGDKEGKAVTEVAYVGKKKKEVFSITEMGRAEFKAWFERPTSEETPRNEFLLKLFFVTNRTEMIRLFKERLEKIQKLHEKYRKIEERLENIADSPLKAIRIRALRYGIWHLESEMQWLKEESGRDGRDAQNDLKTL